MLSIEKLLYVMIHLSSQLQLLQIVQLVMGSQSQHIHIGNSAPIPQLPQDQAVQTVTGSQLQQLQIVQPVIGSQSQQVHIAKPAVVSLLPHDQIVKPISSSQWQQAQIVNEITDYQSQQDQFVQPAYVSQLQQDQSVSPATTYQLQQDEILTPATFSQFQQDQIAIPAASSQIQAFQTANPAAGSQSQQVLIENPAPTYSVAPVQIVQPPTDSQSPQIQFVNSTSGSQLQRVQMIQLAGGTGQFKNILPATSGYTTQAIQPQPTYVIQSTVSVNSNALQSNKPGNNNQRFMQNPNCQPDIQDRMIPIQPKLSVSESTESSLSAGLGNIQGTSPSSYRRTDRPRNLLTVEEKVIKALNTIWQEIADREYRMNNALKNCILAYNISQLTELFSVVHSLANHLLDLLKLKGVDNRSAVFRCKLQHATHYINRCGRAFGKPALKDIDWEDVIDCRAFGTSDWVDIKVEELGVFCNAFDETIQADNRRTLLYYGRQMRSMLKLLIAHKDRLSVDDQKELEQGLQQMYRQSDFLKKRT